MDAIPASSDGGNAPSSDDGSEMPGGIASVTDVPADGAEVAIGPEDADAIGGAIPPPGIWTGFGFTKLTCQSSIVYS